LIRKILLNGLETEYSGMQRVVYETGYVATDNPTGTQQCKKTTLVIESNKNDL
jgi:hypothetical protein